MNLANQGAIEIQNQVNGQESHFGFHICLLCVDLVVGVKSKALHLRQDAVALFALLSHPATRKHDRLSLD